MCNEKWRFVKGLLALCFVSAYAGLSFADQNPPTCSFAAANIAISIGCSTDGTNVTLTLLGAQVVVGQTVFYQVQLNQNSPTLCGFQGGAITITTPDGVPHDATPNGGIPLVCGDPSCTPAGVAVVFSKVISYTVRAQDIGVNQANFTPCNPTNVQATARYGGGVSHCSASDDCDPSAAISLCNPARVIGFVVEKAVACTTGQVCDASLAYSSSASGASFSGSNPQFCYRFIYRNTGTTGLNVTSAVDTVIGTLVPPGGMAPGAVVTNFSGVQTVNSTTINTVTALAAQTTQSCFPTTVVASASSTATLVPSTISCEVRFIQNGQNLLADSVSCDLSTCPGAVGILPSANAVTVVVRVTNTANNGQNIVNGTVKIGNNTFNISGPITPGNFGEVTVDTIAGNALGCHSVMADVTFQGSTTGSCPPIPTSCNKNLAICGTPNVCIIKLVKCLEDNGPGGECMMQTCTHNLSLYAPSATGVTDAAFCYGIEIINCGQLLLTNVVVNDSQLGNSLAGFPTTLQPGQSVTNFYSNSYPGLVGNIRNVATVSGQSSGGNVSANTNALVTLLSPSVVCEKTVSLNGGPATSGGTVEVPFGSTNDLTFAVIVRNNGNVDLANVKVIDTGTSGCPVSTNTIASLPIGASRTNVLCTLTGLTCPPTETIVTNVVTVSAEISSAVCSINPANCQRITTSSSCTNTITLFCRGICITRTPGYWFTHWRQASTNCATLEAAIKANGGKLDLGFICLNGTTDQVLSQALGIFWSKRNKTSDGQASQLCRARKQLAFQLIAAIANTVLLGTDPSACTFTDSSGAVQSFPTNLISQAQQAAACGDVSEIRRLAGLLDAFNNSGDNSDFPAGLFPCRADPRGAKRFQVDPTTIDNCNSNVTNCAAGKACP